MRTRAHTHTHTRTHARTHARTHIRTHARTHTHTHTHTRTRTHAHTQTHMYIAQSTHKLPVHSAKGFANFSASLAMLPPTCQLHTCFAWPLARSRSRYTSKPSKDSNLPVRAARRLAMDSVAHVHVYQCVIMPISACLVYRAWSYMCAWQRTMHGLCLQHELRNCAYGVMAVSCLLISCRLSSVAVRASAHVCVCLHAFLVNEK